MRNKFISIIPHNIYAVVSSRQEFKNLVMFEIALSPSQPFTNSLCHFLTTVESARLTRCCFSDLNCGVACFVWGMK